MDQSLLLPILFGALGGFVRALVGIAKYFEKNKKDQKFRLGYVLYTIFLAALVGGIAGIFANGDWKLALIVGYAGTDFLEGLYKIKKAQGFEI
jgi:fluoride ion exporter CrcB/FEX